MPPPLQLGGLVGEVGMSRGDDNSLKFIQFLSFLKLFLVTEKREL